MKIKLSKERIQIIAVFLITMLICFIPLFSVNCIQGHDLEYHLLRIESLKEGILQGLPFLKINVLFFGGQGYASSLFYPDFLLYIPAVLRCFGVSINLSYHIFVAFCFAAAFASMYCCTKWMFGSRYTALIAAIIYSLAQYHLDDVYTRAAVGEFCAFIFIPFLIYGLYEMVFGKMEKPYIMVIGFSGLVLCHTITTILMLAVYFVAFLFSVKNIFRDKAKLVRLVISAIFVVGITAFYWVPILEQLMSASFCGAAEFDLNYEKLLFVDIFSNKNPGLGIALFVPLILRVFINSKSDKMKFADLCALAGVLAALVSTGLVPWIRLQDYLGFMQFPWRTFMIATPMLAIASAIYISLYFEGELESKKSQTVVVIILSIMSFFAISTFARLDQGYYSYSNDYFAYEKFTGSVIGGEWLPSSVEDRDALVNDCNIAKSPNGEIEVNREKNTLSFVTNGSDYVDVPFIYYKGYEAFTDGNKIVVTGDGDNGVCRVFTNNSKGENVTVKYVQTLAQFITEIISILSIILFAGYTYMRRKKD